MGKFSRVIWGKVLRFNGALQRRFFGLTGPLGPKVVVSPWEPLRGRVQRVQKVQRGKVNSRYAAEGYGRLRRQVV